GDNPMDCITCHNQHAGFREAGPEYFNATCKTCHNLSALREELPSNESKAVHRPESNCFACHMPSVRAEGTPHASFTDHRIRVVQDRLEDTSSAVPSAAEPTAVRAPQLEPYFTADREGREGEIYKGMAYIVFGRQNADPGALEQGIALLKSNLNPGDEFGEAYFLLGFAHLQLRQVTQAIRALEKAIAIDGDVPERLNALAQAYEASGRNGTDIDRLYSKALTIQPALADIRVNFGRFLENQNRVAEAVEQYEKAIKEQPWLETAHYNLGTAFLRTGRHDEAESELREAVHLVPDYVDALGNLGLLLAGTGRESEARTFFERAVAAAPNHAVALGNLGAYYLNTDNPAEAITLLERAVEADPNYIDGWVNLALAHLKTGNPDRARQYADRALRLDPTNPKARAVLEAL
ncbi:MAG: tetratricopeptide repeat protein, partial [Rhodothermales bacterium]